MSTIAKPTIEQQIAYMRKDRVGFENGLTLLEDPKDIACYEQEIAMMKAIEENLIAVKMKEEAEGRTYLNCGVCHRSMHRWDSHEKREDGSVICPKCAIAESLKNQDDKGQYEFKNPIDRAANWPRVSDSVMVLLEHKGTNEWADAYVVGNMDDLNKENDRKGEPGVVVKTYWGALVEVTDINKIQFSKKKEVSNG